MLLQVDYDTVPNGSPHLFLAEVFWVVETNNVSYKISEFITDMFIYIIMIHIKEKTGMKGNALCTA